MIELENLSKSFASGDGTVEALTGINLKVETGTIFGIVGMSGAGKSTLVRCINLLERPTSGRVLMDGEDMTALAPRDLRAKRRAISMIFQQFNLLMQRTCLANICFPMEISGKSAAEAKKRGLELLDIVGLPDKADAYPAQLSGGQKQRVAIARALASDPAVLLCDEATSALDPTTTRAILALIQDINRRLGLTVIVITHEMTVVEEICSHVAILEQGRLVETGLVKDIFSNPQSQAGRKLVYPDAAEIEQFPKTQLVRLVFDGSSTYEPLIASLAIDCGVKVNIFSADMRNIDGKTFGTLMLEMPPDAADAAKALSYMRARPGVTAEEVREK